jgi:hypothetical protein
MPSQRIFLFPGLATLFFFCQARSNLASQFFLTKKSTLKRQVRPKTAALGVQVILSLGA